LRKPHPQWARQEASEFYSKNKNDLLKNFEQENYLIHDFGKTLLYGKLMERCKIKTKGEEGSTD
jgi:hypothetical protein